MKIPRLTRKEAARIARMLKIERELHSQGMARVAGGDEAGRGPLAGPVVSAVVVFPPGTRIPGIDDSKRLTPELREYLYDQIRELATGVGIGIADAAEIDSINILQATKLAFRRALRSLLFIPDYLLLDALTLEQCSIPQRAFVKGDSRCFSIGAASIIANVTRDRMMARYDEQYPGYGFAEHKGYPTSDHYRRILESGITTIHRRTFFDPGFLGPDTVFSRDHCTILERISGAPELSSVQECLADLKQASNYLPRGEVALLMDAARRRMEQFTADCRL